MKFVCGKDYYFQFTDITFHKVTIVRDIDDRYKQKLCIDSDKPVPYREKYRFYIYNHVTEEKYWTDAKYLFPCITGDNIMEVNNINDNRSHKDVKEGSHNHKRATTSTEPENNNDESPEENKSRIKTRKQKVIAKLKIKASGIQKYKKKSIKVEMKHGDTELILKYEKINFRQSDFDTFPDFLRIIKNSYLEELPCIKRHDSCVNKYNKGKPLWCTNVECKGLTEYAVKNKIQKFWKVYEAGQRLEKPFIYIGWKTASDKKSNDEFDTTRIVPFKKHNIPWCYVCGKRGNLLKCTRCTASYHKLCPAPKNASNEECPQCTSGNLVPTDGIVWHKLGNYPWWPAQLINLRMRPDCLTRPPTVYHYSLQYFGENNYAFADIRELCQFVIGHDPELRGSKDKKLQNAYQVACEAFVCDHL